jgi:hypothetical protein
MTEQLGYPSSLKDKLFRITWACFKRLSPKRLRMYLKGRLAVLGRLAECRRMSPTPDAATTLSEHTASQYACGYTGTDRIMRWQGRVELDPTIEDTGYPLVQVSNGAKKRTAGRVESFSCVGVFNQTERASGTLRTLLGRFRTKL